jgi:hypothetical protein
VLHKQYTDERRAWEKDKPRVNTSSPQTWAKTWQDQIEYVIAKGLHPIYEGDVIAFLYDLYPGLPWREEDGKSTVTNLIMSSARWSNIKQRFQEKFGVELEDPVR